MTSDDTKYTRITREEAFQRDPSDRTPVEYEDEITVGFTNFETGETTYKLVKGIARMNGKPSPAIRAYYERLRQNQDSERRESA